MTSPNPGRNLDRILAGEDALLPSSGFAESVMAAIREEASAPAPIPFPWKLALPGMLALIAALAIIVRLAVLSLRSQAQSGADFLPREHFDFVLNPQLLSAAGPVLFAIAASFLCIAICQRWASGWSAR